jgi:hypothetical protein
VTLPRSPSDAGIDPCDLEQLDDLEKVEIEQ